MASSSLPNSTTPSISNSFASNKCSSSSAPSPSPLYLLSVPEHFTYPIHLALKHALYARYGGTGDVQFIESELGTGHMMQALRNGQANVAVALTEGVVFDIARDIITQQQQQQQQQSKPTPELQMIATYVNTPLRWAISTAGIANTTSTSTSTSTAIKRYTTVDELRGTTFGVSRIGSGSHLMACVLATRKGWHGNEQKYCVKGDFKALRDGVNDGSTSAFMWEYQMQKPYYDKGEITHIGDIETPWPCFMVVATKETLQKRHNDVKALMEALKEAVNMFYKDEEAYKKVAKHIGMKEEDAKVWFEQTKIVASTDIEETTITKAAHALMEAGQLPKEFRVDCTQFVDTSIATLVPSTSTAHTDHEHRHP